MTKFSARINYDFPADPKQWNGIFLVGEAPGADEVRLGHPFVGRSGQLLDKMLEQSGLTRAHCIVANVFRVQPPANKVDHFFISRRAAKEQNVGIAEQYGQFGSAWCRADFAADIDHLATTLATSHATRPNLAVMALGRTPLWALTGENGLLERVGKWLPCRLAERINVIPTYHPSYILRGNWELQTTWQSHFDAAKQHSQRKA